MDAKKVMVGLVTVVTLTLFTGAVYAQQPMSPQADTAQTQEERACAHQHHGRA